ncbi:hypothetical protein [Amorphus sp. 3PC139-8]|uniref:hypothetical protein n=1 Tax=Amorphus sp. 3PC139-8 TaxID=2735676 RepID=UPI00345CACAB
MSRSAACSIAKRNAILGGVPKAVWRKAYEAAEATVKGDVKTLSERRDKMLKAFAAFGVKPEQIFTAIGAGGLDDITLDHMPVLTGMHSALKNGEATVEEMFSTTVPAGSSDRKGLNEKLGDVAEGEGSNAKAAKGAEKSTAQNGAGDSPKADGKKEKRAEKAPETTADAESRADDTEQGEGEADEPARDMPEATSDDIEHARDRG